MPKAEGDGWTSPEALRVEATCWDAVEKYSSKLRKLCDPHRETPLDDRLKGVYGRMHVQAVKLAIILAALDWMQTEGKAPVILPSHWETAEAITEQWRASAHRLLDHLDRSGSARHELRVQDRMLTLIQGAGLSGIRLREVYRALKIEAGAARQIALELVRAGLLVETRIGAAEAYAAAAQTVESR